MHTGSWHTEKRARARAYPPDREKSTNILTKGKANTTLSAGSVV